jgi:hypothetical protein
MPAIAATFDERVDIWIDLPHDYPMSPPTVEVCCGDPNDQSAIQQQDAVRRRATALQADWSPAICVRSSSKGLIAIYMMNASEPSDILDDGTLFLGNAACAEEHGGSFYMVVNCTTNLPFALGSQLCIRVPVQDDPFDSVPLFQIMRDTPVLEDMHAAILGGKRVLVHCAAGAQRSPAVVACYLVKHHGMAPNTAIAFIRARRKVAFFWTVNLRRAIQLFHSHHELFNGGGFLKSGL